jgi:hypothetical protein
VKISAGLLLEHPGIGLTVCGNGLIRSEGRRRLSGSAGRQSDETVETPPPPCSWCESDGFALLLYDCALIEGIGDGEVAHDKGTGKRQADRHEPNDAAPARRDVDAGRAFPSSSPIRAPAEVLNGLWAVDEARVSVR